MRTLRFRRPCRGPRAQTVASYAIGQGTLSANANYTISYTGANLVITPATPTVSSVDPVNLGYGTALANTRLSGTASVPGSFSYTTAVGTSFPPATARART